MSRIFPSLVAAMLVVLALGTQAFADSRVTTQSFTVDHNVYRQNAKGMVIHIKFKADGLLGTTCRATAYLYWADGRKLFGEGTTHVAADHQVCSGQDFTPKFDHSKWDNFELFFPYSAFPFKQAGRYDLKFNVEYYVKADRAKLGSTGFQVLTYTRK